MAKIQGLQKRGERFHLRIRVPQDLVSHYNKREIKKSLNTDDYSKAKRRCIKERAVLEDEFERIRIQLKEATSNEDMLSCYSDYDLRNIARDWFIENQKKKSSKKRATKLYLPRGADIFASREVYRLVYGSQYSTPKSAALTRKQYWQKNPI